MDNLWKIEVCQKCAISKVRQNTIGTDKAIDEVIESLKACEFGFKVENELTDYLSWKIVQEIDQGKIWIMQPHQNDLRTAVINNISEEAVLPEDKSKQMERTITAHF